MESLRRKSWLVQAGVASGLSLLLIVAFLGPPAPAPADPAAPGPSAAGGPGPSAPEPAAPPSGAESAPAPPDEPSFSGGPAGAGAASAPIVPAAGPAAPSFSVVLASAPAPSFSIGPPVATPPVSIRPVGPAGSGAVARVAVQASGVEEAAEETGPLLSGEAPAPEAPFAERYFPFLEDESEQGSISVGDTSYGYLIHARHVTEGDSLSILPRQRGRDLGYGSDQMIGLLEDAARRFRARTGTRFWIGNIGRRGGGDIRYSVSHNSGRDADVALAYTDAQGAPVDPPDLVQVDASGLSRDKEHRLRFDAARTWQIIRALLESDRAQIEFLFLARNLTERVLRHAAEKKEPAEIIDRAKTVLHQPGGAPHDDHLHVRVACSERDVEGGCLTLGPPRPWVSQHFGARARRIERAVAALEKPSAEQRARGVERLVLLGARDHKEAVVSKLDDGAGRVRAAAAQALARWGGPEDAEALVRKAWIERDPMARAAMLSALSELGGAVAGDLFAAELRRSGTVAWGRVAEAAYAPTSPAPFLLVAEALSPLAILGPQFGIGLTDPDEPSFAMKLYVIDAAGFCDRPEPVPPLFTLLADGDPEVRAHAAQALTRLLNRPLDPQLQDPNAPVDVLSKAILSLQQKVAPLQRTDRSPWVVEGFSRAGFKVSKIDPEHAWEILRAFGAGEPYSHNAARALTRIALGSAATENGKKAPRPPVFEETSAECRYWLKWLEGHRSKLQLPKEPENLIAACR